MSEAVVPPEAAASARRQSLLALAGWILLSLVPGALGALAAVPPSGGWYATIHKPAWTPPNALFGPVWTVLYVLLGVAAWRVWRRTGCRDRTALALYGTQWVLNGLWTPLFFALHRVGAALLDIVLLDVAVLALLVAYARRDRPAAGLLAPYLLWILFATALNMAIWRLN